MKGRINQVRGFIVAVAVLANSAVADTSQGRTLAKQCSTCHGTDGIARIPIAPNIGGEPADYLSRQLYAFRNGQRQHEMMSVVAAGLDDDSISEISRWYASQALLVKLKSGEDENSAPVLCSGCHGFNGIATTPETPNLAGESSIYIETQLKAFRTGKRAHQAMSEIASDLSNEEMRSVADWYANMNVSASPAGE